MAWAVDALVDGASTSLTDGAPFRLLSARGMAGPPIRRVTARGPAQHGDTDLGYRLQPREIELEIGFQATTDAVLDGYRDDLHEVFKPLTATPVQLRVTRDDAEVRQIDCYTVGAIKIDLLPEYRPGHYHRATVRLVAPDPTYYDPVPGTVSAQGNPITADNWYLGGGVIGTARVLMQGTAPAIGEAWSYSGTIGSADSWTMAWRGAMLPTAGAGGGKYAFFHDGTPAGRGLIMGVDENQYFISGGLGYGFTYVGEVLPAGTTTYFLRYDGSGVNGSAGIYNVLTYYDPTSETFLSRTPSFNLSYNLAGTTRVWRTWNNSGEDWGNAITQYALYSTGLTDEEIVALNGYMIDLTDDDLYESVSVSLQGDMPDYPVIRITGPVTNPQIYHTYTANRLQFQTGYTIGAGTTVTIDLRYGYKTVLSNGSVNVRGSLTPYSDLGNWHLSADFAQGINAVMLIGSNTGTATKVEIVYHHRYSSY